MSFLTDIVQMTTIQPNDDGESFKQTSFNIKYVNFGVQSTGAGFNTKYVNADVQSTGAG